MSKRKSTYFRMLFVLALIVAIVLVGNYTSAANWFNLQNITSSIKAAGIWGYLVFLVLFVAGSFIQAPAMLFVLAAMLTYGDLHGSIVGAGGVLFTILFNFFFVRVLGGKVLAEIEWPLVKRILGRLDKQPVFTVIVLRLILWASPPLNFVLAMTKIKTRHYILGSVLGILPALAIFCSAVYFFKEKIIPLF